MSDLIDRQQAIAETEKYKIHSGIQNQGTWNECVSTILETLRELPSAEPKIVHCRDCKNLEIDSIFHDCWCNGHKVWFDHYCGYAERRTDG